MCTTSPGRNPAAKRARAAFHQSTPWPSGSKIGPGDINKRLSFAGSVSVALALTDKGALAADPELDLIGIPERDRDGGLIEEAVYDSVMNTVEQLPRAKKRDPDTVAEAVRRAVRAAVAQRWGKKPMCHVHVLTV